MQFRVIKYAVFFFVYFVVVQSGFAQVQDTIIERQVDTINFEVVDNQLLQTDSTVQVLDTGRTKKSKAIEARIDYSAEDSMIFDMKNNRVYLYNSSQVKYQEIDLKSPYIEFNLEKNELHATGMADSSGRIIGQPLFKEGSEEFTSKSMKYNFKTKKGISKGVFSEQSEGYIHSEIIKRHSDGQVHLCNGKYTTCDLEHPHFHFHLTKAKIIPGDKIVSGPLYLVLGDVPTPLWLPFGFFPNQKKRHSGIIIPTYGEESVRGFFLKGGFYLYINDYVDFTLMADVYSNASYNLSGETKYVSRYKYSGNLNLQYSSTKNSEEGLSDFSEAQTFWIKWSHRQDPKAHPYRTFSANVNLGTSSHHQLNTLNSGNYLNNSFNSSITYTRSFPGKPINLSVSLNHSQNTNTKIVNLTLPDVSFTMSRQYPSDWIRAVFDVDKPAKQKWYDKFTVGYGSNMINTINEPDTLIFTSDMDMKYGFQHSIPINASYKFLKYFSFSPSMNYKGVILPRHIKKQNYWESDGVYGIDTVVTETVNEFAYAQSFTPSASVSFNPKIFGLYRMKNPDSKLIAVRHMMNPILSFSMTPDLTHLNDQYSDTYINNGVEQEYSIYSDNAYSAPRSPDKSGNISFSLDNNLEMKVRDGNDTINGGIKKVKLLESLRLSSSYNIIADSLNLSDITVAGRTKLLSLLDWNFGATFTPYERDSLGRKINTFVWDNTNKIARMTRISTSLNFSLNENLFKEKKDNAPRSDIVRNFYGEVIYVDFKMPWNLRFDYTYNYTRNYKGNSYESTTRQSLGFSGSVSLTDKLKVEVRSGYDFDEQTLTYTRIEVFRDLHCWRLSVSAVPFGYNKSFMITLNVKASVLQDLKYEKRESPDLRNRF